jgi:hypothetical protein
MRVEKASRLGSRTAPDNDGDDAESIVWQGRLQSGQRRKLTNAGRTPWRPEIEQDVAAPELRKRYAVPACIAERNLGNGKWARVRGKGRQ